MRSALAAFWAATALVALTGCGGSGVDKAGGEEGGDALMLTLATRDADDWEARFAREVARLSHGTMRIDVRGDQHRDEADWEQRTVEDVRAGKFDLGDTGARVWDLVGAESFQALLAPFLVRAESGGLGAVCERGRLRLVHASPADVAALRAAVQPVYDALEQDPLTRQLIAAIRDLRAEIPAAVLPACGGGTASAPKSSIEGRWRVTLDPADLLAVGESRAGARDGQGTWLREFRSGRFAARQVETGIEYEGTYEVRGDILSADFEVCPGMVCTLISETRWSVYRDRLTLTPIPGRPFSSVGVAAPWTRAG